MRRSREQILITKEHTATNTLLNFMFKPLAIKLLFKPKLLLGITQYATLLLSASLPFGMPTFKNESLHLISNIQLVKCLLLRNEWQIQYYLGRNSQLASF